MTSPWRQSYEQPTVANKPTKLYMNATGAVEIITMPSTLRPLE
jgi:hypothetical protein